MSQREDVSLSHNSLTSCAGKQSHFSNNLFSLTRLERDAHHSRLRLCTRIQLFYYTHLLCLREKILQEEKREERNRGMGSKGR